ncbi:hypothetical protein FN846DRAFT_60674 [Sphaerosporella brunnea]|uniref:Uncharacterized protein n=1 Tax=Sphaerosporella brunnea TaxID=1250544 RepID=A0A5J5FAI0_9PEZI|nr:hypothetical protein FN846DRAFT_60674 [Sphaerosporella brunnea]
MNSLFGRSKSKHRNAKGNLKDRIGNPTPIDPININGAFIDLKLTPQDGSAGPAVGLNAGVPPVPQPPIASQHNLEDEGRNEDSSIRSDQRRNQPQPPNRPRHDDSDTQNNHYQVQEYLRGNSGRTVREASDDDVSNGSRGRTTGRNQNQPHTRPFSPLQSADSGRKNISHPAASEDDEVGHSASASLSSVSTSKYRGRALEQTLRTDAGSPVVYTPYSSASPYTSRGRQPEHPARISPDQQQERGRTIGRTTPTEKRSSSNYSSATSIEEPLTYSESHRQFEHRHRPERIDIAPARALQQAETAKYFDADATLEDPVSPLLPSPRRHNRDRELQSSPEISPEFGPTPIHSSPGHLDLDLNKEDASAALDISFSDFSMPAPAMGARDHLRSPEISAPRSPEVNRLPAYLGKMQPVQRQLDYGEPTSPPSQRGDPITSPKRSLSRKVSTKLRTLVGSGGKPREPLPESGIVTTTSISTTSVRNVKGGLNKDAISGPIPIPAKDQQPDPEIEAIMARFDKERGPRPARMAEQIQDKVDVWNYNPSAASSASNISLHPSYKSADDVTITESEASHGNPGLSSHPLRGPANFGDSMKSDTTVKQKDYLPPVGRSEEVPFFLDTTSEIKAAVPSFTHEPPTPEPHKTTFSRVFLPEHSSLGRIDDRNEDGAFSDVSTNTEFTRPSPTISTAPTSVVSSPRTPFSPMSVVSPTARRPPFGPGGPKMMLRSATMSSRPNGGTPLQAKPKPEPSRSSPLKADVER